MLNQIAMAPLFAAILAEGSLCWHRGKLEEAEQAAGRLSEADHGHLLFKVVAHNAENSMWIEQRSMEGREIFGETVMKHAVEDGLDPRMTSRLGHSSFHAGCIHRRTPRVHNGRCRSLQLHRAAVRVCSGVPVHGDVGCILPHHRHTALRT